MTRAVTDLGELMSRVIDIITCDFDAGGQAHARLVDENTSDVASLDAAAVGSADRASAAAAARRTSAHVRGLYRARTDRPQGRVKVPGGVSTAVLVSPEDAAVRLGIAPRSAYQLIVTGQLKAVRLAITSKTGKLMVRVSDLETYANSLPVAG